MKVTIEATFDNERLINGRVTKVIGYEVDITDDQLQELVKKATNLHLDNQNQ